MIIADLARRRLYKIKPFFFKTPRRFNPSIPILVFIMIMLACTVNTRILIGLVRVGGPGQGDTKLLLYHLLLPSAHYTPSPGGVIVLLYTLECMASLYIGATKVLLSNTMKQNANSNVLMQSIGQTNRNVAMQNAVYWPAAGLGWVWEVDMQAFEGEHHRLS